LPEELPQNGDIPKSPLPPIGSVGAVGGHDFNLKIDVVSPVPLAPAAALIKLKGETS
jgi:hypothetical protein